MAVGQRAEPGIAIGWRQRHRIEPGDFRAIGNALSLVIAIAPAPPGAAPGDAGHAVIHIDQPRLARLWQNSFPFRRLAPPNGQRHTLSCSFILPPRILQSIRAAPE
jgi:hypothetical protein